MDEKSIASKIQILSNKIYKETQNRGNYILIGGYTIEQIAEYNKLSVEEVCEILIDYLKPKT